MGRTDPGDYRSPNFNQCEFFLWDIKKSLELRPSEFGGPQERV